MSAQDRRDKLPYPFKVPSGSKPYAHQLTCFDISKDKEVYAIFAEMGCLHEDSEIQLNWFGNSRKVSLGALYERGLTPKKSVRTVSIKTRSFDGEQFALNDILAIKDSGKKQMVELTLRSGKKLRLTPDHEVATTTGWTRADELRDHEIVTNVSRDEWLTMRSREVVVRPPLPCSLCGNPKSTTSPRSRYYGWCRSCIMRFVSKNSDGRTIDKDGYIRVSDPRRTCKQILEHVLVMEKHLGRELEEHERVHHKNENPKNNSINNLELTTKWEHSRHHSWYKNLRKDVFVPVVDQIANARAIGSHRSFDLVMSGPNHNFIADGVVVHNCGKSAIAINTVAWQYDKGKIDGALLISPKGCVADYIDEHLPNFMPDHVKYQAALWNPSPSKAEQKALDKICESNDSLQILAMNVEAFSTKKGTTFAEKFCCAHRTIIILDEATSIKHLDSQRTKNILKLRRMSTTRRIMTGDPTANSPLDLYAQCAFLDPHLLGFSSFYTFKSRYADLVKVDLGGRTFQKIAGYRDLDELNRSIRPFSFIIKKSECLDLPDKVYQTRKISMGAEQARVYEEMKRNSIATLERQIAEREERRASPEQQEMFEEYLASRKRGCPTCGVQRNPLCKDEFHAVLPPILTSPESPMVATADLVIVQLQKLSQIACGFLKTDDGVEHDFEGPNPKVQELLELLEELPKAIIWTNYRHMIFAIEAALKKKFGDESVVTYFGDTTMNERREAKREFRDLGSGVRFFLGNPSTGKFGLTLVEASTAIYVSNSYDQEERAQSEDRIHRIGQTKKANIVDLVIPGTVDQKILNVLRNKRRLSAEITRSNWREWVA